MRLANHRHRLRSPGRARAASEAGITLVEVIVVVAIIGVIAAYSLPSLAPAQRRLHALRTDYARVLDFIDRARFGAMNGASDWLLTMETDKLGATLAMGPDDGWNQVGLIGLNIRANMYSLDDNNLSMFTDSERNDNVLSAAETVSSFTLSDHVKLLPVFGDDIAPGTYMCPTWIRFRHDGSVQTSGGSGQLTVLWLADENFNVAAPQMSSLDGRQEWTKPIIVLPTGAAYLPFED
jgi:prepilin-type N-terminal cleavage/methylation domain-containing protein